MYIRIRKGDVMQKGFQTETSLTNPNRVELYVPEEKKRLIKIAKKLLEKEGKTLSNFFIERLEEYVRLHEAGNPQQTLTHLFKNGKPYRAPSQCGCGRLAEYWFFAENIKLKVCKVCLQSLKMRYSEYATKSLKKGGDT